MRSTINGNVQALQGQLAYLEEIRAGIEGYVNDAEMEVASLTELEDKRIAEDEEVEAERIAGVVAALGHVRPSYTAQRYGGQV